MAGVMGSAQAQSIQAVLVVHRVFNRGPVDAENVTLHTVLPASNRYQDIVAMKVLPEPASKHDDGEGQQIARIPLGTIPRGEHRSAFLLVWMRPKEFKGRLVPARDRVEPLADAVRAGYLTSGWPLEVDKVRPIALGVIEGKPRDLDKARALYDHMARHCKYNIDGAVDAADVVLAGKPASCSELAYTFVALCRSVEIPARVVSGYVRRDGGSARVDWLTHRWAEFFADGLGWVPVDPTHRLNRSPKENFFGRQDGKYLALLDDGVELEPGPDPGWRTVEVSAERGNRGLTVDRYGVWSVSRKRADEEQFFVRAVDGLNLADPAERLEAIEGWKRSRRPLSLVFWLEALLDRDATIRRLAAEQIGGYAEPTALMGLMGQIKIEPDFPVVEALTASARRILGTKNTARRAIAVQELCKSRADQALELLDDVWLDKDREVRKAAANMLYKFGDKPKVHEAYRAMARDDDDFVRILAALRWSRIGSHRALEHLAGHLESKLAWDRRKALAVLVERTKDTFGFNAGEKPTTRDNREAIERFNAWLDDHPEAK